MSQILLNTIHDSSYMLLLIKLYRELYVQSRAPLNRNPIMMAGTRKSSIFVLLKIVKQTPLKIMDKLRKYHYKTS